MTDNDYCGMLFTKARWAYPVLVQLAPVFVWLGILEPTDEQALRDSTSRTEQYMNALYAGIGGYKNRMQLNDNPYLRDTGLYSAWQRGYEYSAKNPNCKIPSISDRGAGAATFLNDKE